MTNEEIMRFDNARLQFMSAVETNGSIEIAKQVKEAYSMVMQ